MMMMSSAALGKYDIKKTKRIPLKSLEKEDDLSLLVLAIRNEFNKRRMAEKDSETGDNDSILSRNRFDECNISPLTVKLSRLCANDKGSRFYNICLPWLLGIILGKDALVKAKTGTRLSAAFLFPAIETVLKASVINTAKRLPPSCVLILCPTRELASQITAEANGLLKYHDRIGVQTLVGGTRFKVDQKRLETEPCQIIGRFLVRIENKSGFSARLMGSNMLILDEADHLLDLGFRKDMEEIVDCVRRVSQLVLKREHDYINTVGLGPETHNKVNQSYLFAPHEQHFQIVHHLLKDHTFQVPNYKVIVFCTTAMMTSLILWNELSCLVIQVGVPVDREQYINRLGRTGREGKGGEGMLLLAP
ncbi:hypothetical protein QVD17_41277 [Tagetes erecta]|uniref:ATP-dependent RNA helicase n=1 Tax=Tagetes erecta TaxID=13708 RepID=A0AAD8JQY8_TARER|nr:hypothetical protein QVD17_41277 [Tagetes erecta]